MALGLIMAGNEIPHPFPWVLGVGGILRRIIGVANFYVWWPGPLSATEDNFFHA